ncbi:hypothetical protein DFH08DRAFT_820764 [Mycena albidolilacea]|uniref:Uncharacterized protein n=1 Tax=Mycena albidolilacea TaxID=1033008 RepID=A0AAD6ZCG1_9AGAR|nr:hypothetical protein DFH08DRAFT_820764 [Mycena albidolilacea]
MKIATLGHSLKSAQSKFAELIQEFAPPISEEVELVTVVPSHTVRVIAAAAVMLYYRLTTSALHWGQLYSEVTASLRLGRDMLPSPEITDYPYTILSELTIYTITHDRYSSTRCLAFILPHLDLIMTHCRIAALGSLVLRSPTSMTRLTSSLYLDIEHRTGRLHAVPVTGTAVVSTGIQRERPVTQRASRSILPFIQRQPTNLTIFIGKFGVLYTLNIFFGNVFNRIQGKICTQDFGSLEKKEYRQSQCKRIIHEKWSKYFGNMRDSSVSWAKIRRPSTPVDGRDFDGRRLEKPSRRETSGTPDETGRLPVVRDP